jgi:hypothetical protein
MLGRFELDRIRKERLVPVPDCPLCEIEPWEEQPFYIPTGKLLPYVSLGHNQLLADMLWLKTILYFGEHYLTDKNYPYLYHLIEIVTDLDPRFEEPIFFGGVVLSLEVGAVEESNLLFEKGMINSPDEWRLPFYLGFNYWYYLKDHAKAAEYISLASGLPGAPSYLPRLAATLYMKSGQKELALRFLRELHNQAQDENLRGLIKEKIKALMHEEG